MGRFANNIRNRFAKRPVETVAKQLEGRTDAYLIRLKKSFWKRFWTLLKGMDDVDSFIHYEGEVDGEHVAYRAKKGTTGACIFKLQNALEFIKEAKVNNLVLVKINGVVKE